MRPRLIAVDDFPEPSASWEAGRASMRPRLIAVDDRPLRRVRDMEPLASMRPRLIAVDDIAPVLDAAIGLIGFNEATADRRG